MHAPHQPPAEPTTAHAPGCRAAAHRLHVLGLSVMGLLGAGLGVGVVPSAAQLGVPDAPQATAPAPTATTPAATTAADGTPTATTAPAVVTAAPQTAAAPTTPPPAATTPDAPAAEEPTTTDVDRARERRERAALQKRLLEAAERTAASEERTSRAADRAQAQADEAEHPAQEPAADDAPTADAPESATALLGTAPVGVPNFFIEKFRIPPFLLPLYQAAGIEYGVRWEILAAINEIETDYGRNLNVSTAGALGWMQFMPATWKQYGVDANRDGVKDPYNPVDAIFAAARYLEAAGAKEDIREAIFAYNHADWYVESVLMRARLIGGLPADLVGSLTGLTQGRFPVAGKARYADDLTERDAEVRVTEGSNAARVVESDSARRGIDIFARAGSPAVAVQDGRIVRIGVSERLGRFVMLRDVYGNTYTYGGLGRVATTHLVPRDGDRPARDEADVADEHATKPIGVLAPKAPKAAPAVRPRPAASPSGKQRLFARPDRPRSYRAGGGRQLATSDSATPIDTGASAESARPETADGLDLVRRPLRVGSRVLAGTTLGLVGQGTEAQASHLLFEIRPAGRGAPRIDPKPILDGWKLLESTAVYRAAGKNPFFGPDAKDPTIGQIFLLGKSALQRRVLANPRIEVYECGRRDIRAGIVDHRVLATLEFLAASGLEPTITSLRCGHGYYTASGNVSEHTSGTAIDIAKINGIPIQGHQGEGSVTDLTIRRLLTLQGTMKPHQIISLMSYEGADNTLSLPDHADHIHVGFRPQAGGKLGGRFEVVLKPGQWTRLIDRLGEIENPTVEETPSAVAVPVRPDASSRGR